jgi:LysR family transcriptional activator of nhaA
MKAFGARQNAIFVAPALEISQQEGIYEVGRLDAVSEEYHILFAERMIQHPAVQRLCHADFSGLFPRQSTDEKKPA